MGRRLAVIIIDGATDRPADPQQLLPERPDKIKFTSKTSRTSRQARGTGAAQLSWGPALAVVVTFAIYLGAQLAATGLLAAALLIISGDRAAGREKTLTGQFLYILLVETLTVGLLAWFLRRRHASRQHLGLVRPTMVDIPRAAAGFVGYLALYVVAAGLARAFFPDLNVDQRQQLGFDSATRGPGLALVFIGLVILPPLVEELLMRGFLYGGLRQRLSFLPAAALTSLLFALAHLQPGSGQPLLWIAAIDTFTLSMVLVYLKERYHSLWPSIGLHMIKNGVAFSALFLVRL